MIELALRERTVNAALAASQARGMQRDFLIAPGERHTHADVEAIVARLAGALSVAGVKQHTRVALMVERSPRYVWLLLALARLGAVAVALNTESKGRLLAYYLEDSASELGLVDGTYAETFGQAADGIGAIELAPGDDWLERIGRASPREADDAVAFHDWFVVLYTSGTTGMPKAVPVTHAQAISCGAAWSRHMGFAPEDRLYTCLPFFHINATAYSLCGALVSGASLAIGPRFSARSFWGDVRALGATQINGMGSMLKILQSREPHPVEQAHGARTMFVAPLPSDAGALGERFALDFATTYAQTEWLPSSFTSPGEGYDRPGGTGAVLAHSELRIAGEHDETLPPGSTGEILLRPREPFTTFTGYLGKPEASLAAFRNLWFHTGDLGTLTEGGLLSFRGRAHDVIRRRGENISPSVVEDLLGDHPSIAEVSAVAVPSALLEDEVFAYVVLRDGFELGERELLLHAREVMPRHMVPRYVQFVPDLPRTATNKIERLTLKERAARTIDRGEWAPVSEAASATAKEEL